MVIEYGVVSLGFLEVGIFMDIGFSCFFLLGVISINVLGKRKEFLGVREFECYF